MQVQRVELDLGALYPYTARTFQLSEYQMTTNPKVLVQSPAWTVPFFVLKMPQPLVQVEKWPVTCKQCVTAGYDTPKTLKDNWHPLCN